MTEADNAVSSRFDVPYTLPVSGITCTGLQGQKEKYGSMNLSSSAPFRTPRDGRKIYVHDVFPATPSFGTIQIRPFPCIMLGVVHVRHTPADMMSYRADSTSDTLYGTTETQEFRHEQ